LLRVLDLKIRPKTEGAGMTGDDRDDEILDWRLVKVASRECHEREPVHGESGRSCPRARSRRRRPPAAKAQFIPFPLARRRGLVLKLAEQMASARTGDLAELVLRGRAAKLSRALQRSGMGQDSIAAELSALETAVRAELWNVVLRNGRSGPGVA
jgi:Family of unknown function (DUF6074)